MEEASLPIMYRENGGGHNYGIRPGRLLKIPPRDSNLVRGTIYVSDKIAKAVKSYARVVLPTSKTVTVKSLVSFVLQRFWVSFRRTSFMSHGNNYNTTHNVPDRNCESMFIEASKNTMA